MTPEQMGTYVAITGEVDELIDSVTLNEDGEHLWDNFYRVRAAIARLGEIRDEIAQMEILGQDWPEIKKYRTLILDPKIERLEKDAAFESRKITAKLAEYDMEKR
jgi:hypothetical protein